MFGELANSFRVHLGSNWVSQGVALGWNLLTPSAFAVCERRFVKYVVTLLRPRHSAAPLPEEATPSDARRFVHSLESESEN